MKKTMCEKTILYNIKSTCKKNDKICSNKHLVVEIDTTIGNLKITTILKFIAGAKDLVVGLYGTFDNFEIRAAFTDRKNTLLFAAVMLNKFKWPFSCLKN
jgi:hypothetical protein